MLDGSSKLIAIDEETDHEIVHGCRFGKTNRATHETLDPGSQIDVLALDFLRMLLANTLLLWVDMPLVGIPPIRVIVRDAKRLQQCLQLEKNGILSALEDVGEHVAAVIINRVPQPPWVRFAAHATPHCVELCRALRLVRDGNPAPARGKSRLRRARDAARATPCGSRAQELVSFFHSLQDRVRTDMQNAGSVANAAPLKHRHAAVPLDVCFRHTLPVRIGAGQAHSYSVPQASWVREGRA